MNRSELQKWIAALPPDAIVCVVNAWRDAYDTTLEARRPWHDANEAACQAFRDSLASLV